MEKKRNLKTKCYVKSLRITYNNLERKVEQKQRKHSNKMKKDSNWFKIINPVLSDTSKGHNDIVSRPCETSFFAEKFIGK